MTPEEQVALQNEISTLTPEQFGLLDPADQQELIKLGYSGTAAKLQDITEKQRQQGYGVADKMFSSFTPSQQSLDIIGDKFGGVAKDIATGVAKAPATLANGAIDIASAPLDLTAQAYRDYKAGDFGPTGKKAASLLVPAAAGIAGSLIPGGLAAKSLGASLGAFGGDALLSKFGLTPPMDDPDRPPVLESLTTGAVANRLGMTSPESAAGLKAKGKANIEAGKSKYANAPWATTDRLLAKSRQLTEPERAKKALSVMNEEGRYQGTKLAEDNLNIGRDDVVSGMTPALGEMTQDIPFQNRVNALLNDGYFDLVDPRVDPDLGPQPHISSEAVRRKVFDDLGFVELVDEAGNDIAPNYIRNVEGGLGNKIANTVGEATQIQNTILGELDDIPIGDEVWQAPGKVTEQGGLISGKTLIDSLSPVFEKEQLGAAFAPAKRIKGKLTAEAKDAKQGIINEIYERNPELKEFRDSVTQEIENIQKDNTPTPEMEDIRNEMKLAKASGDKEQAAILEDQLKEAADNAKAQKDLQIKELTKAISDDNLLPRARVTARDLWDAQVNYRHLLAAGAFGEDLKTGAARLWRSLGTKLSELKLDSVGKADPELAAALAKDSQTYFLLADIAPQLAKAVGYRIKNPSGSRQWAVVPRAPKNLGRIGAAYDTLAGKRPLQPDQLLQKGLALNAIQRGTQPNYQMDSRTLGGVEIGAENLGRRAAGVGQMALGAAEYGAGLAGQGLAATKPLWPALTAMGLVDESKIVDLDQTPESVWANKGAIIRNIPPEDPAKKELDKAFYRKDKLSTAVIVKDLMNRYPEINSMFRQSPDDTFGGYVPPQEKRAAYDMLKSQTLSSNDWTSFYRKAKTLVNESKLV